MAKDDEEERIKLKPYTAQNVVDTQNRKIKKLNKKIGKTIAELWKPRPGKEK